MKLRGGIVAVLTLVLFLSPIAAADSNQKGLSISPSRKELTVNADKSSSADFTVTNVTDSPMTINFAVKEFSVSDYSYDYTFTNPTDNWIKLTDKTITLQPHQSKQELYDIEVPAKATPSGYYFTLLASSTVNSGGVNSTLQASSLLYLTVNGKLVRTSVLKNSSIPWLVVSPNIPYKFDVLDTGNIYFTAFFFGQVEGLFGSLPQTGTDNLVYPGKPRTISDSTPSPAWPGVYRVTYGYKVDFANITISQSSYILYLPPWSIVAGVLIILVIVWSWQTARSKKQDD